MKNVKLRVWTWTGKWKATEIAALEQLLITFEGNKTSSKSLHQQTHRTSTLLRQADLYMYACVCVCMRANAFNNLINCKQNGNAKRNKCNTSSASTFHSLYIIHILSTLFYISYIGCVQNGQCRISTTNASQFRMQRLIWSWHIRSPHENWRNFWRVFRKSERIGKSN